MKILLSIKGIITACFTVCISIPIAHAQLPSHSSTMHAMPAQATHMEMDASSMAMHMNGAYGHYPMMRDASGTSWQPQSTPFTGILFMPDKTMYMLQGFINGIY